MLGAARARSTSVSGASVPIAPFCEPLSRRCRVSLRVSISEMPIDAVPREVRVERLLRAVVRDDRALFANHEARDLRLVVDALRILIVDAGVADLRRGHGHDLTGVRRIGEHLLVAGHAGREHDLTDRARVRSEGPARKNRTVGQSEVGARALTAHLRSSRMQSGLGRG